MSDGKRTFLNSYRSVLLLRSHIPCSFGCSKGSCCEKVSRRREAWHRALTHGAPILDHGVLIDRDDRVVDLVVRDEVDRCAVNGGDRMQGLAVASSIVDVDI